LITAKATEWGEEDEDLLTPEGCGRRMMTLQGGRTFIFKYKNIYIIKSGGV
jgi:hypothetical protein